MSERLICRICGLAVEGLDAYRAHRDWHIARTEKRRARDEFVALLMSARADNDRAEAALKRLRKLNGEAGT